VGSNEFMSINHTPRDQQQDSLRQSQLDCDRPVREVQQVRLRSTHRQVVRAYRDISRVTAQRAIVMELAYTSIHQ
jgi:hypothetical protein